MVYFKSIQSLMKIKDRIFYASKKHTVYILTCMAVLMLVKDVGEKCMLVKNMYVGEKLDIPFGTVYLTI